MYYFSDFIFINNCSNNFINEKKNFLTTTTMASGLSAFNFRCSNVTKNEGSGVVADIAVAFELEEETISSLREKLSSGKYTSEQLVQLYLDRIETIDKNGLELHLDYRSKSEAIAIAKTMDAEMKAGKSRGPFVPVIKDRTADKMQTTAGSLALKEFFQRCFVVERLRDAGAIIIGKTNLSEWANFRSQSCSGWSSRGGQTKILIF
jgi:amidase